MSIVYEVEYNDERAFATQLYDTAIGWLGNSRDVDWFTVSVPYGGWLAVSTFQAPSSSLGVWNVYWYDSNMQVISGQNIDNQSQGTALFYGQGTIYIRVQATAEFLHNGSSYTITVEPYDDYRNSIGDTSKPIGALTAGESKSGNLESQSDVDFFEVTLSAGEAYVFELKGVVGGGPAITDPILTLWDSAGNMIAQNDDFAGSLNSHIAFTPNTTGTYYLSAAGWGQQGSYSLYSSVNHRPTGTVEISGVPIQGATLVASHSLADADGLGTIVYQWQVDGSDIAGATGSAYSPGQGQVGRSITVVASYVDGLGYSESMASAPTGPVANVNDSPTGAVTIGGVAMVGQVLAATNSLTDPDGIGQITYQWQANGVDIAGAVGPTFVVTSAQVGAVIRVAASYVDGYGASEQVISAPTIQVPISGTSGPDILNGTAGGDSILGLNGNDLLWGGEGNDTLDGGLGDDELVVTPWDGQDMLIGGDGVDFVSFQPSWWGVYVVLSQGAYGASFVSIDGLTGSNFDDVLSAGTLPAKLYGGMGNDVLVGGPGEDLLNGGYGDDYLYVTAYDGADVIDGGPGYDILSYGGANTPLYIDLSFLYGDSVTGIEAVQGSKFDDTMVGTSGNDRIDGNEGNDVINAGAGNDTILMRNWDGADTVNGGEGSDTVSYEIANTGISASLVAPTYGDTFTGVEHLTGSAYADTLVGDGNANRLTGLAGNDTLTGGAGADTFVFNTAPNALTNLDTILDFVSGTDKLEFSKSVFAGLTDTGTLSAEQFWSGAGVTSAHDADDRFMYDTSSGALYYDADGLGGVDAVQVALLGTASHTGLVHGDIIVGH